MDLSTWLIPGAIVFIWLLFAAYLPRHATWFVVLWVPVQGWAQLNFFDDSDATVLIYEIGLAGLYLIFFIKALKFPKAYSLPGAILFAVPFAVWTILMIPHSLSQGGLVLTVIGLRTYLLPLPLVWLGYHAFQYRTELERLGALLSLEMAIIGLVSAVQFANLVTSWGTVIDVPTGYVYTGALRPPGTFSTPAHLGMYILAMVPLGIGFLGLKTTWPRRISYGIGLTGAVLALVVNSQRAAVVLLCVCLPLIVVVSRRVSALRVFVLSLGMVAAGVLVGVSVVQDAFAERVRSISDDAHYALLVAPVERMTDALQKPLTGGGLGSASPGITRLDLPIINSAESFMAALVYEFGVPGLVLFYVYLAALTIGGFRILQKCRRQDIGLLAAAILVYQIMVYLQSWTYDPLHYPPGRVIFWFWAGVLLSLPRIGTHPSVARPSTTIRGRLGAPGGAESANRVSVAVFP